MNSEQSEGPTTNETIPAILLSDIEYTRCPIEGPISVPAGTHVFIDADNFIALIGEDHVHIEHTEYKVLSPVSSAFN